MKTVDIASRRYLGNKFKLLPFIKKVVEDNCPHIRSMIDIFAGTGVVAAAFNGLAVTTNDILYSNYLCNFAYLGDEPCNARRVAALRRRYNAWQDCDENYMSETFADTYFSRRICTKIGAIREDIEAKFAARRLNARERAVLITSLLYAMDRIANTCGHYDAYRKKADFRDELELLPLRPAGGGNEGNLCYNEDANALIRRLEADLLYIDPPYNSRQYGDAYHLLENLARWEKPPVRGVARKMDRRSLKSRYCTSEAADAFADLIANANVRYIILSYNNMADKGNDRSNAKLADEAIMDILGRRGEVRVFTQDYKPFSAGKSAIKDNQERLFLCVCQ